MSESKSSTAFTIPDPLGPRDAAKAPVAPKPASPHGPAISAGAMRWIKSAGRSSLLVAGALTRRRRAMDGVIVGLLITVVVIIVDAAGLLTQIEFLLYDTRASLFQFDLPRPTDKLVHLDVDEGAIDAIGRWPWPRSVLAEMLDEVALAGPKVVGLDITFPEAQEVTWQPPPPEQRKQVGNAVRGDFIPIDHDKVLGESLERLGCALVPISLPFERQAKPSELQIAVRAELAADLNQTQDMLTARVRRRGNEFDTPQLAEQVAQEYLNAWRVEMLDAIGRAVRKEPTLSLEQARQRLLKLERSDIVLENAFDGLFAEAQSIAQVARFSRPIPASAPALFSAKLDHLPVPPIAQAAAYMGNVQYASFRDGRVRAVPMFVKNADRMYPQMGLAMACAQLDVDIAELAVTEHSVTIPATPSRPAIVIPHRTYRSTKLGEEVATFIDIPWWGNADWAYMYDHPAHVAPVNHVSVVALWDLVLTKRKIDVNAKTADAALISVLAVTDQSAAEAYAAKPPPPHDIAARRRAYEAALPTAKDTADMVRGFKPADLDDASRRFIAAYDSLPKVMSELDALDHRLRDGRADMAKTLGGKSVIVGWTATSIANADVVPTSIHPLCPGVVLHGAIFNGIMTGEMWRTLPPWMTLMTTFLLGLIMTAAVAFLTPGRALVVALVLMAGYAVFNGLVLFDYNNLILGAAGPLLCVAGVWQGCTLVRLVVERYQRYKIEGRFRSYVDPALVDYVVKNPEQAKLEGQIREMTVCFTDLGNFTPLTVMLKEATVPLLNRIFDAMVPAIRRNNGYVNKFLGDGVMFFFGAPRENPDHARDALRAVLDIQLAMNDINRELAERGLPQVTLRAGVNTGNVVVGDAGSEKASDYTVLGDDVNLASRMETANKQLGTSTLASARTIELAGGDAGGGSADGDGVLARPVGQICVVGRSQPVLAYEILARRSEATEAQHRLAELTRDMVDAFREARLDDCLRGADELDRAFGPSKLTSLYRDRCEQFLRDPASMQDFNCTIVLSEK